VSSATPSSTHLVIGRIRLASPGAAPVTVPGAPFGERVDRGASVLAGVFVLAALGLLLASLLSGCTPKVQSASAPPAPPSGAPAAGPATQPHPTSARTPWVKARSADGVALLEAPARVLGSPDGQAAVAPPFRARVTRILVRAGEQVTRGQAIAQVAMPDVIQAAGAFAAATTRLEAYLRRKEQLEALRKDGLVKLSDLLEAETRLAEARADQQTALGTLRAADLGATDVPRLLEGNGQVAIRSPIAGTVTEVRALLGETREPSGEPLARVAAGGETRVEARLAHAPPPGARFEFVTAGGEHHPLKPLGNAPVVDGRDGTTAAWFAPTASARLPSGLAGTLVVRLDEAAAAVPARAVALDAGQAYVLLNGPAGPRRVPVEVLASSGADALVRGGIKPGDEVAADAALASRSDS
jgi:multidrug efflux pump subunit AcrA (membrane-fusion protein)